MAKRKSVKTKTSRVQLAEPKLEPTQSQHALPLAPIPESNDSTDSQAFSSGGKMQFQPVGASGTELQAGYFSEEYFVGLRGKRGAKVYDEIRRSESQVSMLMNAIKNPIKAATSEFEAAPTALVPDAEKHKALVEYCAKEMIDWETHLHEVLTFLEFGFAVTEVVNNVVFDHPRFGTFNGLKALAFRSQKTIERWLVDRGTGELKVVEQYAYGDTAPGGAKALKMDAKFLLVFTLQKEGDNYEGISALRPMYGAWFRKNLYLKIAGIGVEKNAIGTPIGTIPAGKKQDAAEVEKFKEVLENFTAHESSYLMVPEGWKIEIIKNDFDPSKIKELILLENTEMINCVVANFLALGMNGGGGSFALGTDLSDFFLTGIQNYAAIVAGVWNRVLIPNLVKLNFGPQAAYPKLKFTGINDKAGKELAEIVKTFLDAGALKADDKLETFFRKVYNLPAADPATVRETPAPAANPLGGLQFNERRIMLAEGYKSQWNENKKVVKTEMQTQLQIMLDDMLAQLRRQYKSASSAAKVSLGLKVEPKTSAYRKAMQETLAKIADQAVRDARKETPKAARDVKLSERIKLAAPRGGYFDALPANIKRLVSAQAQTIVQTQAADLSKVVAFQYSSSQVSTEDIDQIVLDIEAAAVPTIEGSTARGVSVDAAAGNAVSSMVNQSRMEWFFEPEVLETIESFTFYNEDPVSEICQELDGQTWKANDPDLDRYSPPLHHNCKSRLMPNEKGAEGNPEATMNGTAVSQKALDSITLCECEYHLEFKLAGHQ